MRESRYEILTEIASGGMATVFVGRLRGAGGFSRLVAIKRAHPHVVQDIENRRLLLEEARHASKLHHPNVVAVQDVEEIGGELRLVMDYVEGGLLAQLLDAAKDQEQALPAAVVVKIVIDACAGLQAAHDLTDELGAPFRLIHRDVTPQNVLVGIDGVARLTDFGIAKSVESQLGATASNELKGKIAYMAPEYVEGGPIDVRIDVWGLGVTMWEALANRRLFRGGTAAETLRMILEREVPSLCEAVPELPEEVARVVAKAVARDRERRFASAADFARALGAAAARVGLAAEAAEVGRTVRALLEDALSARRAALRNEEQGEAPATTTTATVARPDGDLTTIGASGVSSRIVRAGAQRGSRRGAVIAVVGAALVVAAAAVLYVRSQVEAPASATAPASHGTSSASAAPSGSAAGPAASSAAAPASAASLAPSAASSDAPSAPAFSNRRLPPPRPAPPAASFDPNPYK